VATRESIERERACNGWRFLRSSSILILRSLRNPAALHIRDSLRSSLSRSAATGAEFYRSPFTQLRSHLLIPFVMRSIKGPIDNASNVVPGNHPVTLPLDRDPHRTSKSAARVREATYLCSASLWSSRSVLLRQSNFPLATIAMSRWPNDNPPLVRIFDLEPIL
jgi:hypothetical protein